MGTNTRYRAKFEAKPGRFDMLREAFAKLRRGELTPPSMLDCEREHHLYVERGSSGWFWMDDEIKNYRQELQKFFQWIAPYVEDGQIGVLLPENSELFYVVTINAGKAVIKSPCGKDMPRS